LLAHTAAEPAALAHHAQRSGMPRDGLATLGPDFGQMSTWRALDSRDRGTSGVRLHRHAAGAHSLQVSYMNSRLFMQRWAGPTARSSSYARVVTI
jgi:hypothetical protein